MKCQFYIVLYLNKKIYTTWLWVKKLYIKQIQKMWVKENLENTINSKIFINIKKIDLDEDLANKNIDILKQKHRF